jgi:predicted transcriptional regulator
MKRLIVTMPDELHEELRELAHRKRTTMARLMRVAVETVYEDELDAIAGEIGLEDYLNDREGALTIEEYIAKRKNAVPG